MTLTSNNVFRTKNGIESVDSQFVHTDLTVVENAGDLTGERQITYDQLVPLLATYDVEQYSLFAWIFSNLVKLRKGIITNPTTTYEIVAEGDWFASVGDAACEKKTYNNTTNTQFTIKGGETIEVRQVQCIPCPISGTPCALTEYDIVSGRNNEVKANKAFAKSLDLLMFRGEKFTYNSTTKKQELTPVTGKLYTTFDKIAKVAQGSLPTKSNYYADIVTTMTAMIQKSSDMLDTTGYGYMKRRDESDFVILISNSVAAEMDATFGQCNECAMFTQYKGENMIPIGIGSRLLGYFKGLTAMLTVDDNYFPSGVGIEVLDLKSKIGDIVCTSRRDMPAGSDVDFPDNEYFYKKWLILIADTANAFGDYSFAIPRRGTLFSGAISKIDFELPDPINAKITNSASEPVNTKAVTTS